MCAGRGGGVYQGLKSSGEKPRLKTRTRPGWHIEEEEPDLRMDLLN